MSDPTPRTMPNPARMYALFAEVVAAAVDARERFSVRDITGRVRQANPTLDIPHEAGRIIVHAIMNAEISLADVYMGEDRGPFILYTPKPSNGGTAPDPVSPSGGAQAAPNGASMTPLAQQPAPSSVAVQDIPGLAQALANIPGLADL